MQGEHAQQGDLIGRFQRGDRTAFAAAVKPHWPAVQRLVQAIARDTGRSHDAAQETLVAAFRGAASFDPRRGALRPWLLAIARREAYRARAGGLGDATAEPAEDEEALGALGLRAGWSADDPEHLVARAEDRERLSWALASLSPGDREVVWLRDVEGLSGEETAAITGIDLGAMKSRLHRARLRVMAAIREGEVSVVEQERTEGGLTCSQVLAQLSDYVDGQLPAIARQAIVAHLTGCTVCERFGGRFRRTVLGLRTRLGAPSAVDEAAYLELLERFERGGAQCS